MKLPPDSRGEDPWIYTPALERHPRHYPRTRAFLLTVLLAMAALFSFAIHSFLSFINLRNGPILNPYDQPHPQGYYGHGVIPVPCHSHNDYWRDIPLLSALSAGCISIEADVWPDERELQVGHSLRTVQPASTLRTLYLNPLEDILRANNLPICHKGLIEDRIDHPFDETAYLRNLEDPMGVFPWKRNQSLTLLIDFKDDPESTWDLLNEQLTPLREIGMLSYFNGTRITTRPLTIIASGNAPFDKIMANPKYRDIFYDAPLDTLPRRIEPSTAEGEIKPVSLSLYNKQNSIYASADFSKTIGSLPLGRLSQEQLARIQGQVQAAHALGLKVRYWGTPTWPVGLRNYVWRVLVREGVDILNVDDLYGATKQEWSERSWWF